MSNISFCILITKKASKIFINLSRYAFTAFILMILSFQTIGVSFLTYKVVCHCNSPSYWICIKFSLFDGFFRLRPYLHLHYKYIISSDIFHDISYYFCIKSIKIFCTKLFIFEFHLKVVLLIFHLRDFLYKVLSHKAVLKQILCFPFRYEV